MRWSLLFVAACSLGVTPPPKTPTGKVPDCTSSSMLPSFDTLSAIAQVGAGAASLGEGSTEPGIAAIGFGVVYAAAALYGWHVVKECRRATDVALHGMSKEATQLAGNGDCSQVREMALRLAQDSQDAYEAFIHDPKVSSCF